MGYNNLNTTTKTRTRPQPCLERLVETSGSFRFFASFNFLDSQPFQRGILLSRSKQSLWAEVLRKNNALGATPGALCFIDH